MTKKKKLGGLGKLSQFSGIKTQETNQDKVSGTPKNKVETGLDQEAEKSPRTLADSTKPKDKMVNVNIKIASTHRQWLADTAQKMRDNNVNPVPAGERVYPQHLIGIAVELLQNADVDWDEVKNMTELKNYLKL